MRNAFWVILAFILALISYETVRYVKCYCVFVYLAQSHEPEKKKEKDVHVIDLTVDSDTESDMDEEDDEDQEYEDERGLNTPRYMSMHTADTFLCRKSQISFCKILKNKWYHATALPMGFHLNGHIIGFYSQIEK